MNVVVIGGGMSGMVCGIVLSRTGHAVTILERNSRLGKKISVTGNGRCNITNSCVTASCYNNSPLVHRVLDGVTAHEVDTLLDSVGIFCHADSVGRVYPITDNANSVVDCLRIAIDRLGIRVVCNSNVERIDSVASGYAVVASTGKYNADRVILSVGSGSGAVAPDLAALVGSKYITKLVPSLVPMTTVGADKTLNGIRAKVTAILSQGDSDIATNSGEVLFKDYGLSGICMFDLSASIAQCIKQGNSGTFTITLDLLPTMQEAELCDIIFDRLQQVVPIDQLLLGLLHNKLAINCINRAGRVANTMHYAQRLSYVIKHHAHTVGKLLDISMSQVTCGGVASNSLSDSLQLPNGVYCCGEVCDVSGLCGGYNLHYAIRSALYVAKAIGR